MNVPVQVTFRHISKSDAIETECWREAAKLERYFDRIMGCKITIDEPHRHHRQGNLYQVRIDLTLPGTELVITREPPLHHKSEAFQVALREAFDSIRRRLEDYVRIRRGDIKRHESAPTGRIASLFPNDGYGFIQATDEREIYFHAQSVLHGGFSDLKVGDEVSFVEEPGEEGPQASTVHVLAHAGMAARAATAGAEATQGTTEGAQST